MFVLFKCWSFEVIDFKVERRGGYTDFSGKVRNNSGTDLTYAKFNLMLFDEGGICYTILPLVFSSIPAGNSKPFRETIFNAPGYDFRYKLVFKEGY